MIELGRTYKDKITGFQGVATGYVVYLSGCNQALLAPPVDKNKKLDKAEWLDEQRLDPVGEKIITLDNVRAPGFDLPAPVR